MGIAKTFRIFLLLEVFVVILPRHAHAAELLSREWWLEPWLKKGASQTEAHKEIKSMLLLLKKTNMGARLLKKARAADANFFSRIAVGNNSLTETVFSRSFSLSDGLETVTAENFLKLNRDLNRKDLILDLGHELTHFVYRVPANPYAESHGLGEFIREGIEGRGGELDAFESECYVSWELERKWNLPEHELCSRYKEKSSENRAYFVRSHARHDYYNVGQYFDSLVKLRGELPDLNRSHIVFSSSLQKAPYPFALVEEFAFVRKTACENNLRKASLIAKQTVRYKGRGPASAVENLNRERNRLEQFARENCPHTLEHSGLQHE